MRGMNGKIKKWKVLTAAVAMAVGFWVVPQGARATTAISGTGTSITVGETDYSITYNSGGATASGTNATAVGENSEATGEESTAIGYTAKAYGAHAIALGANSNAYTDYSYSVGNGATVGTEGTTDSGGLGGIAIGSAAEEYSYGAMVTGDYGIAIGTNANASGEYSHAFGYQAGASGEYSLAVGSYAKASGRFSLAVGHSVGASGSGSASFGDLAYASGLYSTAIGHAAFAFGESSSAYGTEAEASGEWSIALGTIASVSGDNAIAIGPKAFASGDNAIAIGAYAANSDSTGNTVSFGHKKGDFTGYWMTEDGSSTVRDTEGDHDGFPIQETYDSDSFARLINVAYGTDNHDAAAYGQLVKNTTYTVSDGSVTIQNNANGTAFTITGLGTSSSSDDSLVIGDETKRWVDLSWNGAADSTLVTRGINSTAYGYLANASGQKATAIGYSSQASNSGAIAIGDSTASGLWSIAIGDGAQATSSEEDPEGASIAIGSDSKASEDYATAIGAEAAATGLRAYAIGTNAAASGVDAMALGNFAVAEGEESIAFGYSADALTFGSIAFGRDSEASGGIVASAFGYGSKATQQAALALGAFSQATGIASVAIGGISQASDKNATAVGYANYATGEASSVLGNNSTAQGTAAVAIGYQSVANTAMTEEDGDTVKYVSFGHKDGDEYIYMDSTTSEIVKGNYSGNSYSRLTNVAKGTAANEAATWDQLIMNKTYTFDSTGVATIETNESTDSDKKVAFKLKLSNGTIDTGNGGYVTGGDIYTELRPTSGTYVNSSNTTAANLVALDTKIGTITGDTTIVEQANSVSTNLVALENAIKSNKSETDSAIDSVTLENKTYTFSKTNAEQNITYKDNGGTAFTIKIEGLGEGGSGGTTYTAGNGIAIDTTSTTPTISANVAEKGGLSVDKDGLAVKVAEKGGLSADENGLSVKVAENGGLTADDNGLAVQKDGKVASGNTGLVTGGTVYDAMKSMDNQVSQLSDDIQKVGAGAAALAALHPEGYDPNDKWSFAVGYGHYKGANAGALGAFFKPNADTTVSVASTVGNGDSMVNMGVSFKLGNKGKKAGTYRSAVDLVQRIDVLEATMAKEVKRNDIQDSRLSAQEKEIKALRADSSLQAQKIAQLQADIAKMQQQIAILLSDSGMAIY